MIENEEYKEFQKYLDGKVDLMTNVINKSEYFCQKHCFKYSTVCISIRWDLRLSITTVKAKVGSK